MFNSAMAFAFRNLLQVGDSGSIVYEERRDKVNQDVIHQRPLGMFVGRHRDEVLYPNRVVYQALFLKQALDDIASAYSETIADVQPFTY